MSHIRKLPVFLLCLGIVLVAVFFISSLAFGYYLIKLSGGIHLRCTDAAQFLLGMFSTFRKVNCDKALG
jgi:hypothetical protein